jgi:Ran GTPase-activating protein 1
VRSFIDLLAKHKSVRSFNTNNTGLSPEGGRLIANGLARRLVSDYEKDGENGILTCVEPPLPLEVFIAGRSRLEDGGAIALSSVFERMGTLKEVRMPQNGIRPKGSFVSAL